MPVPAVFDLEGPIINPAIDFARIMYDSISRPTRSAYPNPFEVFDSYDDARWRHEREYTDGFRHSTGTTPLVVDCLAAIDGMTDETLVSLARRAMNGGSGYNPGAQGFLRSLTTHGHVYIVTSSFPAIPLMVADDHGINYMNVFSHGRQKKRFARSHMYEVQFRSPIATLSRHRDQLANFISGYLDACGAMLEALDAKDDAAFRSASERHDALFDRAESPEFRIKLRHMFLLQHDMMGGHKKRDVVETIAPDGNVAYLGDSIVDVDATDFARYGFSVNCTNEDNLRVSKLNLVTSDFALLEPVLRDVQDGTFELAGAQARYETPGLKIFTQDDVRSEIKQVADANGAMKKKLKAMYAAVSA